MREKQGVFMDRKVTVAIIGAGAIADMHLEVLKSLPFVQVKAICDVSLNKAQRLAKKYAIEMVFDSLEKLIKQRPAEIMHVLVPPDSHFPVALSLLKAQFHVFLEKPIGINSQECQQLIYAAEHSKKKLYVNHNYPFHPIHLKCKKILQTGNLGKIHHVILYWNMPFRHIASKKFGHWMFQEPGNILLEQCIHPLSQIYDLLGNIHTVDSVPSGKREIAPGQFFFDTWNAFFSCEKTTAELFFSVGQSYSSHAMTVLCDDGEIHASFTLNTCTVQRKTPCIDALDRYQQSRSVAWQLIKQNFCNLGNYLLSTLRFQKRTDAIYISMKNSIQAFYDTKADDQKILESKAGARLVEICQIMAGNISMENFEPPKLSLYDRQKAEQYDALILGGTGFIGRELVKRMVDSGAKVLVAARNIKAISEIFYHQNVTVVCADSCDRKKMDEIISGIPVVIYLADGGYANTWEEVEKNMIQGCKNVAQACLDHNVQKLLYIGSITSLYLGKKGEKITGRTPRDMQIQYRDAYNRGKAKCEEILEDMQLIHNLPLCILRPGIILSNPGNIFHSGLGLFNQDAFCLGWNRGNNPLPFVLLEDVATAICLAAASEQVIGKSYNIVGDVRLTAKEHIQELSKALERKITFIPQFPFLLYLLEILKWFIQVVFQRKKILFPSYRYFRSRGMLANFDCKDLKEDLGWYPESNRDIFIEKGIKILGKKF